MEELLRVGTSSWSHKAWTGTVYPPKSKPGEYLGHYASRYRTVEIDATWYRIPSDRMIRKWEADTPDDFRFAAKVPSVVTHEKMLVDCDVEFREFLRVMDGLGAKRGPLLLQFPYSFGPERMEVLRAFLGKLPQGWKFAIEIRHRGWLKGEFHDLLRERGVALAMVEIRGMPRVDVLTADFAYVRFIGDRKGIERKTKTWDKVIEDRTEESDWWAQRVDRFLDQGVPVWAYFNNHFAGHAPGSIALFLERLKARRPTSRR